MYALAVRGFTQQLASVHGLRQSTAIDRVGNRSLHSQQVGLVLGHTVQVLAQQLGCSPLLHGQTAIAAVRNGVANAQTNAFLVLPKHLFDQQQRSQRLVEHGRPVKQRRVTPVNVDGHDGRLRLSCQTQKARVPAPIAHPFRVQA